MITLERFQENWKTLFLQEKNELQGIFSDLPIHFHHIGSTSIEGCDAKPIIDILGVTSDVTKIDSYNEHLQKKHYTVLGEYGMKQRRFFKKRGVHLHIFEDSDPEVCRHLRFVNYLSLHPELIKEYSKLKRELAKEFPEDIQSYLLGKEKWIKKIDILAAKESTKPHFYPSFGKRKENWREEEIVRALHVNMHLQMAYFAKYVPVVTWVFEPDATVICSSLKSDVLNYVLAARFTERNLKERIQKILSTYKEKKVPFSWWVSDVEDTPDYLSDELQNFGLTFKEENCGMYLKIGSVQEVKEKENFIRVDSLQTLKDFSDVIVSVGGSPEMFDLVYRELPEILYKEGSSFEMYVFYKDHKPVTTGIVVFHANVAGIYYIATKTEARRHGFGTEMMRTLLNRAFEKEYSVATLQASSQGKALYERMGFKACCRFMEYAYQNSH